MRAGCSSSWTPPEPARDASDAPLRLGPTEQGGCREVRTNWNGPPDPLRAKAWAPEKLISSAALIGWAVDTLNKGPALPPKIGRFQQDKA